MKKFLQAHYEKIILAALLIIFTALLYYQLMFIQRAQNKYVDAKVNPVQKPSDYESIDFSVGPKYKMETIFSDWNTVASVEDVANKTQMMAPYPMAECVFCHALIPANAYPAIGETKNGKCPACGKALAPRVKVEENELAGKADQNGNGIPDEWEKEQNISAEYTHPDSDEDNDGFSLIQEFKAKTDPTDAASHPKYITQVYVDAISQQRFTGLELVSVDMTKEDKKNWQATFNVVRNNRKRSEFVRIDVGTFKNNNVDFSVVDIEVDDKTQTPVVYIQRVGKVERIACRPKQPVYDPAPRVRFLNVLLGRKFISSVGAEFSLGTDKTGKEVYKVVSADPVTKDVVVESVGDNPETIKIGLAPKETATDAGRTLPPGTPPTTTNGRTLPPGTPPTTPTRRDDSPFLQRQR
ncbi:MAG: hypothetical protein IJT68_00580 [Lentisphaeria bacterium]|nr:hypothetical protein [Lentisphaeria bacterium]